MPVPQPSFAELPLGAICTTRTYGNPQSRQINEYPGINGIEVLNLGSRGGTTEAEGLMWGSTFAELASLFGAFTALQLDGGAYTLVDIYGVVYQQVILVDFRPAGLVKPAAPGYAREFKALFLHIL